MVSVRFTPGRRGRTVPAVILAAALATAAAACTSSGPTSSAASSTASGASASPSAPAASTAKVTGAAATALITTAIANTKAAPSLTVVGSGVSTGSGSSSQTVSFDLTLVQKAGCRGTIALSKTETFQLVETGGYVWLLPSSAYYTSLHLTQAELALVAGKYIKVPSDNSTVTDLTKICSFTGLFGELPTPTGTAYVATPTTYQGKSAYEVTQPGQPGYLYITNSPTPVLAKLAEPTTDGGVITFTESSTPLQITAPSGAQSIDGTQLGL
jgi:hypothetical protein